MDYLIENKLIAEYLRELKLPSFKEYLDLVEQQAINEHWTYRHFLCELMSSASREPTFLK